MAGSIKQERKGLRPGSEPKEQPVQQHDTSGPKPKPMTDVKATPAETWFN